MIYKKIHREFLIHASAVKFEPSYEGQKIEDNKYIIGNKAGPDCDPFNLIHEMCHFCELETNRLLEKPHAGWGLSMGRYWEMETHMGFNWGWEQFTDQQVQREARVWAYQLSLHRHFGYLENVNDIVGSATYLPAWTYYQPFKVKTYNDTLKLQALAKQVEKMTNEFTYERFCHEWKERNHKLSLNYHVAT